MEGFVLLWIRKYAKYVLSGLFVVGYPAFYAVSAIDSWLPESLDGTDVLIHGVVTDFPRSSENGWQFDFYAEELGGKIKLTMRDDGTGLGAPVFSCRYNFLARLRRPRGLLNFQQYDYQVWLLQAGYRATGSVKTVLACEQHQPRKILSLRSVIADWINHSSASQYAKSTLLGLLIGSYAGVDAVQWRVLRDSGTIHLLSVSGLHIVLIAALAHFCVRHAVSFLVLPLRWMPVGHWAGCAAVLCATVYALLAGFSVATQRSLVMVVVAVLQRLLYGRFVFGVVFLVSIIVVWLMNPLSLLSAGFWFSYWATAILLLSGHGLLHYKKTYLHAIKNTIRLQCLIFLMMSPLLFYVYDRVYILSLPLNFIAVPWVSLVALPLGFMALLVLPVFPELANQLLLSSAWALDAYWYVMRWGVGVGDSWQWVAGGVLLEALLLAIIGLCLLCLAPRGFPLRCCGVFLCLPFLFPRHVPVLPAEVEVTVLDVGQGLSVIARTKNHVLVYDTGDRHSDRFDAGRDIVAPALRDYRQDDIDVLIISHADADHAGGSPGLLQEFSARQLWSGTPDTLQGKDGFLQCRSGMHWQWDGVSFKVLSPHISRAGIQESHSDHNSDNNSDNNNSCVVMVDANGQRLLLTGDIEKEVEQYLVRTGEDIHADMLLSPHHGSKTSSSEAFLDAVGARHVIVSAGFRNRFHHPADNVLARYRDRGMAIHNTAESGAVRIKLSSAGIDTTSALCEQHFFWRAARYNIARISMAKTSMAGTDTCAVPDSG